MTTGSSSGLQIRPSRRSTSSRAGGRLANDAACSAIRSAETAASNASSVDAASSASAGSRSGKRLARWSARATGLALRTRPVSQRG